MDKTKLPDYDIAIIGGGASGIYTAWRMLKEGNLHSPQIKKWKQARGKLKIAIFERSERMGGRLLSAKSPHLPNLVCEIGGMRFVSNQNYVRSLVLKKFKLPHHSQTVDVLSNRLTVRG
jgi:protoporphyrinogen oxidase